MSFLIMEMLIQKINNKVKEGKTPAKARQKSNSNQCNLCNKL